MTQSTSFASSTESVRNSFKDLLVACDFRTLLIPFFVPLLSLQQLPDLPCRAAGPSMCYLPSLG